MQRLFILIILAILLATVVLFSPSNTATSVADTGTQIIEEAWIWNQSNNHYYALTEPMSWTEAEAWAQERGGHLVTLRNWEEELWVKDKFGQNELFWIGFNDIEEEGNWVWSSGEPVVYTNWHRTEPNNCGDFPTCYPEDAAVMNWAYCEKIGGQWFTYYGDYWNDFVSSGVNRGVAEILASFEEIPEYTLTVSSTVGGSVTTPGERTFTYDKATVVNLIAKANEGYQFDNWIGDVETIANVEDATTTIIVDSNYAIAANFKAIPKHTLTISSAAGGSVTNPGEGTFTYDQGTGVNLVVKAEEGFQFVEWSGDVDTIADVEAAATTITMNDDYSIIANFEAAGGCFIATAAYGTPIAEEIQILREFRDEYLLTNSLGKGLVDVYYTISPPIAGYITEHPLLKSIVRAGLIPIVALCNMVCDIIPQAAGNKAQ